LHPDLEADTLAAFCSKARTRFASLGRSPGKGDAVVMAWSEGNKAAMHRAQKKPYRAPSPRPFYSLDGMTKSRFIELSQEQG
jgi:hypothetical protein